MAASLVFRRWCSTTVAEAATAPTKSTRWQRLRNGRAGRWLSGMFVDYKEAVRETFVGARERPIKAGVYLSLLGGTWACFYTNPEDGSFETSLKERANQLGLLSPWIRNGVSDGHMQKLVKLQNHGCLRHVSLGVLSLTYRADYDPDSSLYEARCSALSVPWRELPDRMLDVGFAGRWWVLDAKMKDYDVNDEEFRHLPPALFATVPPAPQVTELNEQMHKDSWKPIALEMDEEERERLRAAEQEEGEGVGVEGTQSESVGLTQEEAQT
ncbi:mitochondrial import inner membrane translocase subunit Tim29 [Sardina pilchardus]|uniref:mitochondrial import inner membrane translocase subunit Tim29 n=1 Tax=Sardina pilchardus TaxID=27697 RepID=UPI002E0D7BC7